MALRVLYVENDPTLACGLSWLLRDIGFEVEVLAEGRPALGLIASRLPDIVLLDLTLPDIDGVVVAHGIRNLWPALPIIFTTGHGRDHPGLREALDEPNTILLEKPFAFGELLNALAAISRR